MVDFNKLRASKAQPNITSPIEIFRRLPKPPEINDLYQSQAQVLQEWDARRNERDVVIKLHTGGGKTLVALLIAHLPPAGIYNTLYLIESEVRQTHPSKCSWNKIRFAIID
jgi:superfamily II DNA or RNA helicase